MVGYVVGTPDITDFLARYPSYVDQVLSKAVANPGTPMQDWTNPDGTVNPTCLAQTAYSGEQLLRNGREELCDNFPATLHVNVLEGWRNGGLGRRLVKSFLESLPEGSAVHLEAAGTNTRVVPFYELCGFEEKPGGEKMGSIWMVTWIRKTVPDPYITGAGA